MQMRRTQFDTQSINRRYEKAGLATAMFVNHESVPTSETINVRLSQEVSWQRVISLNPEDYAELHIDGWQGK